MEPVGRLYLDTNMFILLGEGQEDDRWRHLLDVVSAAPVTGAPFLCTSQFTLAELLVVPFRRNNDKLAELYEGWVHPESPWLEVAPVDRDLLIHTALVREQFPGVKMPDAIHLATALLLKGCTHILTADKRIPRTSKITMTRWGLSQTSKELTAIEPSVDNLKLVLAQLK
ncbi:PIN domain-containing protein [Roseibium sp. AS2]|uniref:type II toxin-antitoxin system VapC family toxin n=1 Tax=Roseibium sp. AS2 TaxID=3135781 RepID=UPI00317CB55E